MEPEAAPTLVDAVEERARPPYSVRSATIGSRREAFQAG